MNKILQLLFSLMAVTFTSNLSFAIENIEGRERNGGDDVVLEFQSIATSSLTWLESMSATIPELKDKTFNSLLDIIIISSTENKLTVMDHGVEIEVTAINIKSTANSPAQIIVNRARWQSISSDLYKQALATHELLGLMGLESTGHYEITEKYLDFYGITCSAGSCLEVALPQKPEEIKTEINQLKQMLIKGIWKANIESPDGSKSILTNEFREDNTLIITSTCMPNTNHSDPIFVRLGTKINYLDNNQIQYLETSQSKQYAKNNSSYCYVFTSEENIDNVQIISANEMMLSGYLFKRN